MEYITVKADMVGERIDSLLARTVPELTRSAASRLIENGCVTLGGRSMKKNYRVTGGESFLVTLPELVEPDIRAQEIPLDIVFEDEDIVVINKPRGMVVHPAPGHFDCTLVNALLNHCGASLSGIGGEKRPGIVHRIDKDTSGLIIAAKNDFSHLSLSAQLADHSLSRIYEAVVWGRLKTDNGSVDAPIGRHTADRKRMAVTRRASRNAVTHYEVICRYKDFTHVRCRLETGRTHQIRVHMAYIGHPLLGDMVYGHRKEEKGLKGQCLHARSIKFIHPRSGKETCLSTPLPGYFSEILSKLGPEED